MTNELKLKKKKITKGTFSPPGSKSITNRALLLSALSSNEVIIKNILLSEDSEMMMNALSNLGVNFQLNKTEKTINIKGVAKKFPNQNSNLFLGNAGTAFRPLTAALALQKNCNYKLEGIQRMHERPIKDLVDALVQLGANINYLKQEGYPPLEIISPKINDTKIINVKGNISSQYLSSLLMALPLLEREITINIDGDLISKPYIELTLKLLEMFNIFYVNNNFKSFSLKNIEDLYLCDKELIIEPDASSASYFFAAAAINGEITIENLNQNSIQGDIKFLDYLSQMGASVSYKKNSISVKKDKSLSGGIFDCINIPDAAMSLAVLGLFTNEPVKLINIKSWKVKETDRILAMANELTKLGAKVEFDNNSIQVSRGLTFKDNIKIDTYNDHRMAMSFSLASFLGDITINDPGCVNKTYPDYFNDFEEYIS
jgi:3-phosphoshikimate 1-carboxyvinyltransferase